MRRLLPALSLCLLLALPWAGPAHAQAFNRCVGEDGVPIYTDRACSDLGARERGALPTDEPAQDRIPALAFGCARDVEALLARVREAVETENANSLAGLYDWTGASGYTARAVMPGLEAVARRRLVEMGLEHAPAPLESDAPPTGLWLDQHDPDRPGQTLRSRFGLVMNAGCWWLRS